MADNVIQHLEMSRDKQDRQRTFRMNECLSAYVDPATKDTKRRRRSSDPSQSTETDSDADSRRTADGGERIEVITRAAELLREAMDIEEDGGGVLYLDTAVAANPPQQLFEELAHSSRDATAGCRVQQEPSRTHQQSVEASSTTIDIPTQSTNVDTEKTHLGSAEILAHTYKPVGTSSDQPDFLPFTPEQLLKIIKRYPRGRMFTYDQQGQELSDCSDTETIYHGRPRSKKRRERSVADSAILRAHFPKARQIMFTPIWDSTTSRSAACFIYNCSEYRNFTHQLEFLNCIIFNNCVDTELLRLSNLKATEQKTDFIGSISHELRSPLHGILASCEFLQDTTCTSFQQSLVKTAESCAKTLLDTVNMVLDYSKINAFEKHTSGGTLPALTNGEPSIHRKAFQSDLNTHRKVDIAILTEEVVEGVASGHVFNHQSQTIRREEMSSGIITSDPLALRRSNVELIVEIPQQDWTYWCEPGSIRRIVMNLVGNALKYTQTGFVHVKLDTNTAGKDGTEKGILTVTDSGQGISPAYLRDKLYTPFAQESNQAPGVGLGLSLVKSIVDNLGGHINVISTVGVGTTVTVIFPLVRKPSSEQTVDGAVNQVLSETKAIDIDKLDSMPRVQPRATEVSIALYWQEDEGRTSGQQEASQMLRKTLTTYLNDWSREPVRKWQEGSEAEIIVVEEAAFNDLLRRAPLLSLTDCRTTVLVLRGTGSAKLGTNKNIEDVRHPIGPHKIAQALQSCLKRYKVASNGATEIASPVESITSATLQLSISSDQHVDQDSAAKHDNPKFEVDNIGNIQAASITTKATLKLVDATHIPQTATVSNLSSPTRRILLVDDNAINLRLLQIGMKKHGYKSISSAADGLQAVNTYHSLLHSSPPAPPDIIFMDLSMPVMNGFDATRKIREIEAEHNSGVTVPHHSLIIALTGLASMRDQKEAYTAGVDSYIMKPVNFAKLTKLLEDWTADTGAPGGNNINASRVRGLSAAYG